MKRPLLLSFAVALLVAGFIARGQAHNQAVVKAKAIVALDNQGEPVTSPMDDLKFYVASHTGASVQLSLSGSFLRAQKAAEDSAKAANGTGQVYAQAQASCAGHADSIVQARCVAAYVATHPQAQASSAPVAAPDPKDYIFAFKSPLVTYDLATALFVLGLSVGVYGLMLRKRT